MGARTTKGMYKPCLKEINQTLPGLYVNSLALVNVAIIPKGKQEQRRSSFYRFNGPLYSIKSSWRA